MCSESVPKEFEKTTEVLPLSTYGLSTVENFRKAEADLQHIQWLKKAGLSKEELKLYQENEAGVLDAKKIECSVLENKLETIYSKINAYQTGPGCSKEWTKTSIISKPENLKPLQRSLSFYPEGHPMNELRELEKSLFGHLKDDTLPITKRRKIMRRLERKKDRILAQQNQIHFEANAVVASVNNSGGLWDMKEVVPKPKLEKAGPVVDKRFIGPRVPTMYTIKDNKIMRLESVNNERNDQHDNEFRAVDIVMPVNPAEEQLLEGTKMPLDDIKKIDRFKDYEPGIPSKVLYLKNIAPSVSQEQLSLLFNQFVLDNGGPIDIRLMAGRMRGQAFVSFQSENLAIQALEEINGTILSGRPIIAQFGRNSNRIQPEDNR